MRFMIFVPGSSTVDGKPADVLKAIGLEHLARGIDVKQSDGPNECRGRLFWWQDSKTAGHFQYMPEKQTWIPSAKCARESGAYWIGFFKDSPPTEEDLRKPDHRSGAFVKLGNGDRWSIVSPNSLDRFPLLNADGTLTWVVDESFNWLVTDIQKRRAEALTTVTEDGIVTLSFNLEKDWHFLCSVLAINYRITPEVVSTLRLFSQQSVKEMIATLMDMPLKA